VDAMAFPEAVDSEADLHKQNALTWRARLKLKLNADLSPRTDRTPDPRGRAGTPARRARWTRPPDHRRPHTRR